MDQKPVLNYPARLAFLFGLVGGGMLVCSILLAIVGSLVLHVPPKQIEQTLLLPENTGFSKILNTVFAFLAFCLPAFILARIISKKPLAQLGFSSTMSAKQVLLVFILIFVSLFLSGALGQLNEWIPLPHDWYVWAKDQEEKNKANMMSMATMRSAADYLIALLVLAVFPAIFEEVLFRGGLQQIMVGWTRNKWWGIIITSILFSAIHLSYFGFLPRIALGMVLGLIFYYSKNIWLSILLHFLNNALVVTQLYMLSKGSPVDKAMNETIPMWYGLVALAVLVILFRVFKKESETVLIRKEQMIHSSPENIIS